MSPLRDTAGRFALGDRVKNIVAGTRCSPVLTHTAVVRSSKADLDTIMALSEG